MRIARFDLSEAETASLTINFKSPFAFPLTGSVSVVLAQNEIVTSIGFIPSPSNGYVVLVTLLFHSPAETKFVTSKALEPSPS